jgi:hypothetical protein
MEELVLNGRILLKLILEEQREGVDSIRPIHDKVHFRFL